LHPLVLETRMWQLGQRCQSDDFASCPKSAALEFLHEPRWLTCRHLGQTPTWHAGQRAFTVVSTTSSQPAGHQTTPGALARAARTNARALATCEKRG